jgi:hypothetical protein
MQTTRDALHLPSFLLVAAVRGTIGRPSSVLVDWLTRHWPALPPDARQAVRVDLETALWRDDIHRRRTKSRPGPLGTDKDRAAWERVRRLWRTTA